MLLLEITLGVALGQLLYRVMYSIVTGTLVYYQLKRHGAPMNLQAYKMEETDSKGYM